MKKLILIDGNALVHRAFHALPPLTSPKGVVTNAVFGFSSILIKVIREQKPDYIAAAFDLAGPTFRHEEFAEYKIHREKAPDELYNQLPIVKEVLAAFGVPVFEREGYEADDLIGTLATKSKTWKDVRTVIATGDLDTLQLVDGEKITVFTLRKGVSDTIVYDQKAVFDRYGLKPEQMNDYKGLKGDPSDNIPGVPGVGEKTASVLIQTFQNLEGLYDMISGFKLPVSGEEKNKIKPPLSEKLIEKLIEYKDQAFFSRQLATIITDMDIDVSLEGLEWRKKVNVDKISKMFKDLGFSSLLRRLPEIGLKERVAVQKELAGAQDEKVAGNKNHIYITGHENKEEIKEIAKKGQAVLIGYDLKGLFKKAIESGTKLGQKVFDVKIAAYLLSPGLKRYELAQIFYAEFGESWPQDPNRQASAMAKLMKNLQQRLETTGAAKVFENIEMPLIKILARMELYGIKVNTSSLAKLSKSTNRELGLLERKIHKLAGVRFNISSPQQLGDVLFNKLGLKGRVRKTTGGALSTAAPELEKLREEHPIIDLVLQYRELQKLKTTYIDPFPVLIDKKSGRLHTTLNQTGTATGRLASENPNLQNIPVRTALGREFRKSFIAENGWRFVSCDYSQLELRIVAHLADDKKMVSAFKHGEDIHIRTAAEVFNLKPEEVTQEMRRQAKALNFGIIYGMGAMGFARSSGVSVAQAKEFIAEYFREFSGIAAYMEEMKNLAHKNGWVETIFGRRRYLLDINSTMPQIRAQAERMAINHPVQGTEADLMKMAMIKIDDYIRENHLENDIRMLLQIHDELLFEVRETLLKKTVPRIKVIMETIYKLDVPLIVDVKSGLSWEEQEPHST